MGITWATPGTASRRRRTVQSAAARRAMGSASPVTARNITSPITEVTGARVGWPAPGGSAPRTPCSFSDTTCRAR